MDDEHASLTAPPPLPEGDEVPSAETIADALAQVLPEPAREAGRQTLLESVLPHALARVADHPRPRAMAEVVYENLATALAASNDPEVTLNDLAMTEEVRNVSGKSLSLAIARYVKDHPDADGTARSWLVDAEQRVLDSSVDDLREQATDGLAALDRLEAALRERPELWETRRTEVAHARLNLQSARSGSFETATGPLNDFLREMGERPATLDIH